ncbi:MAG: hypothetical protein P0Y59_02765 [Candidatus Sphingomonas phytovorans]|nr:hypothetical protein [Sphingomonas sp.]WEK00633.1 MAG: hypothetical protein P0Y59_02765 [Sphingomonas sp.]
MANALVSESNELDHKDGALDSQAAEAFGARIRARADELGLTASDLVRVTGIKKQSMTGYWAGKRLCGSDKLFALSDALRVSARWLIEGVDVRSGGLLVDAAEADWVNVPRYDLRQLTDTGKGEPVEVIPFRRDLLYRRLSVTKDIWLTELPGSNYDLGLKEGDLVFCSDMAKGDGPYDGWTCIWRGTAAPFVASYSSLAERPGGITGADVHREQLAAVGRVRAVLLAEVEDQRVRPGR